MPELRTASVRTVRKTQGGMTMEFKNIEVSHIQHALRGMRNAMSGWDKSDTITVTDDCLRTIDTLVGTNDRELARRLIKAGAPHRKFIIVIPLWR